MIASPSAVHVCEWQGAGTCTAIVASCHRAQYSGAVKDSIRRYHIRGPHAAFTKDEVLDHLKKIGAPSREAAEKTWDTKFAMEDSREVNNWAGSGRYRKEPQNPHRIFKSRSFSPCPIFSPLLVCE